MHQFLVGSQKGRGGEFFLPTQHNGVAFGIHAQHVGRFAQGDAQSLALPHGVEGYTLVCAQRLALGVHIASASHAGCQQRTLFAQKVAVVTAHKAHLHAFALAGAHGKTFGLQVGPHFGLRQVSQRKEATPQGVLRHAPQKVALVLTHVVAHQQIGAAVVALRALHIMPCGHKVAVQTVGPLLHQSELEMPVAAHTGIGRPAVFVFVEEIVYNVVAKGVAHVGHVVFDAEAFGQFLCRAYEVRHVVPAAEVLRQVVHTHGHAHHPVALLLQHEAYR